MKRSRRGTCNHIRPLSKGLIANIVQFGRLLRKNGISVSFSSVLDVLKGLHLVDISRVDEFYHLLRFNIVSRKEDIKTFDQLFNAFWRDNGEAAPVTPCMPDASRNEGGFQESPSNGAFDLRNEGERGTDRIGEASLRYSPYTLYRRMDKEQLDFVESPASYESISSLLHPLANRLSRRYQYTIHGKEVSLRRILRKNMQFGGELIFLDFKRKRPKRRRILFFCDVSGSMDVYTIMIIQFVHALRRVDPKAEIFFFSTDLTRVTPLFDLESFSAVISKLPEVVSDWKGGTRIGHCLTRFVETYASRLLTNKAIVMIFSDGWDRGEIDLLEGQMAHLKRRAYKIIWLNPLLGTEGYQPICRGMGAALPYVDYFLPITNLHDLHLLEKTLEEMVV